MSRITVGLAINLQQTPAGFQTTDVVSPLFSMCLHGAVGAQPVKEITPPHTIPFHGIRRPIAVFTRPLHWALSWTKRLKIHSNIILACAPVSPKRSIPFSFLTKILCAFLTCHMRATQPTHPIPTDSIILKFSEEFEL
jgi:hypothetical protein